MTSELTYLILTMILAASMWIPYIVGVNMHPRIAGDNFLRPPPLAEFPDWVHRAHRAHLNLIETAMPFAALVVIAHVLGISTTATTIAAAAFFWLRMIHAIGMVSGFARFPVRPILFVASWLCTIVIGVQILIA